MNIYSAIKSIKALVYLILAASIPANSYAIKYNSSVEECYAAAMIGYDYVINSRAGLPIERALNTISVNQDSNLISEIYKTLLPSIVKSAYQWQGTPHEYAVEVMYLCAFKQGLQHKSL